MTLFLHRYSGERRQRFCERYREDPVSLLRLDDEECERLVDAAVGFYRDHLEEAGLDGYAVGLSGGIDSTTVAYLLGRALDPGRLFGAIMPADHTDDRAIRDAEMVASDIGMETNDVSGFRRCIGDVVDTLEGLGGGGGARVRRGNILARCRMIVLRDHAKARGYLVAGTTNASERDLGYMTLAADGRGGVDNEGIYELYKTSVRDLARYLGVPDRIVEKEPSADLWSGQSDSDELGFGYAVLDQVLAGFRLDLGDDVIADAVEGIGVDEVERLRDRVERNRFKREMAPQLSFV